MKSTGNRRTLMHLRRNENMEVDLLAKALGDAADDPLVIDQRNILQRTHLNHRCSLLMQGARRALKLIAEGKGENPNSS